MKAAEARVVGEEVAMERAVEPVGKGAAVEPAAVEVGMVVAGVVGRAGRAEDSAEQAVVEPEEATVMVAANGPLQHLQSKSKRR